MRMSALIVACTAAAVCTAGAQEQIGATIRAGGEWERYLRLLEVSGAVPRQQWSVRPFTDTELAGARPTRVHPWEARLSRFTDSARSSLIAPTLKVQLNTGFPDGANDGVVWAGRGATVIASGGWSYRIASLHARLEPVAFVTENRAFRQVVDPLTGVRIFTDRNRPELIDLPERFGTGAYGRLDAGESQLSVEGHNLTVGLGTRTQVWGPVIEQPYLLSANAGGFPHLFTGTARPVGTSTVRIHGRMMWGVLTESGFSPQIAAPGLTPHHFATGMAGGLRFDRAGLELGVARFFHTTWGAGSLGDVPWLRNLELIFKDQLPKSVLNPNGDDVSNQLASVYFRWGFPDAGVEVYGEFGRDDHSGDVRDLAGEPDHDASYAIGMQRVFRAEDGKAISAFRAEVLNARLSHLTGQSPAYIHAYIRQGHTQRGQILGAAAGHGGGATTFAYDRYTPAGRSTFRLDRQVMAEDRFVNELPDAANADVRYAAALEQLRFRPGGDLAGGVSIARELNRYFSFDAWSVGASLAWTPRKLPWR